MSNLTTKQFFDSESVKNKFQELLGNKAPGFISSVLQTATQNKLLAKADPVSIYTAAMMGATLDLPINQNLGFAWIVPYKGQAQFQMGWRGFVQLAQRTGQYKSINVVEVHENQFESFNALTEEFKADFTIEGDGNIVGYCAYFQLLNGFEKTVYWTRKQAEDHGKRYSKAFNSGPWKTDFDAMAKKTVLKNMLSKWGILSIEMQKAVQVDQGVIVETEDGDFQEIEYVDNPKEESEELAEVDEETFEQMKEGIRLGTVKVDQICENYDITDEQKEELLTIQNKKS